METRKTPIIICRVIRPELTPEERDKRMAAIKQAATDLIVASMKVHRRETA